MENKYKIYLDYIQNTGGSPLIDWFDDDWEPIGPQVRTDMRRAGLIKEKDGKILLNPEHPTTKESES